MHHVAVARGWQWLRAKPARWLSGLALVLVAVLGLAALVTVTEGFRAEVRMLHTGDDDSYAFEIRGCSNAVLPVSADRRYGTWRIVDVDSGDVVADNVHAVYTPVLISDTFGPRGCKRALTEVWDGRYWNQDETPLAGRPIVGDPVPTGMYRLEASWGELHADPLEFDV